MKKYFLILTALGFLNCSTDSESTLEATPALLQGKWVEASTRKDTLIFEWQENPSFLALGRERELQNGVLVPKAGAGLYQYELSPGKIALNSLLSSSSAAALYDFTLFDSKLRIGNFYGAGSGSMLTFVRLE